MAEGGFSILNQPIDQFIQCIHCSMLFKKDHFDYWPLSSIVEYLIGISDTTGCEYLDEYYFDTAYVPCDISCPHCGKDFETVAQVSASPIWHDDDMWEGRVPYICYFEDVEILKVSMFFEKTTSIQECFKCDIDFDNPEDVELNVQNVIGIVESPSSCILKVIAKTKMSKGFCYLGLEERTGGIFRPIFNTSNQQCCWPTNAELMFGMLYKFYVILYPNPIKYFTPFPHRNEDMIVSGFVLCGVPIPYPLYYPTFSHLAKNDVEDIFKDIKKKRYVNENTQCSSVGILKSSALIAFNPFKQKYYCKLKCKSGVYVLPITATHVDLVSLSYYTDAVIVLGLGRPYKGKKDEYDPARCYLLAVGIYLPSGQTDLVGMTYGN